PRVADVCERSVDDADDIGERDLPCGPREPVPTLGASLRRDDAAPTQLDQDALEELARDLLRGGEAFRGHRLRRRLARGALRSGEFGHRAHRIIPPGRQTHGVIITAEAETLALRPSGRRGTPDSLSRCRDAADVRSLPDARVRSAADTAQQTLLDR